MSRSRYAVLPLVLGLVAGTACEYNLTDSEPYDGGVRCCGWPFPIPSILIFHGVVTSAASGERLLGVTVRIDAPARGWSETALTDSAGYYVTNGLPDAVAGDCAGLSVSFSRDGYQPLRLVDFPLLTCGPGYGYVSASLTPTP